MNSELTHTSAAVNDSDMPSEVERFNIHYRIQHVIMLTSFLLLFFTGWALKFSEVETSYSWIRIWGGPETAGKIHRIAGIAMLLDSLYHVVYLLIRFVRGKLRFDIVPVWKDVVDFYQNILYLLGLSKQKPQFGRFTYLQKFDYWAVFWGIFIIGSSGLALAFPTKAALLFPEAITGWIWELLYVMHSDEALLAIVFILFWHFYNEHLRPEVFPMSWVWITGKISIHDLKHHHPMEYKRLFPEAAHGADTTENNEES
jgi:cytochrome b subunit of formate dehydrogenase